MANELVKIENQIVKRFEDGSVEVSTYKDRKPNRDELVAQIQRLQYSFQNVNDGIIAELVRCFHESGYTFMQVSDIISNVIQTNKYKSINVAEVLGAKNGIVKLVSGRIYNTKPTEEVNAEYYPITKINGVVYLAKKEEVDCLNDRQKQVLREIYRESFLNNN